MSGVDNCFTVCRKRCCGLLFRLTSNTFSPYFRLTSRAAIDCPMATEPALTCRRNRFADRLYSLTNCASDFPVRPSPFALPLPERNHLVRGNSTSVPTATHTKPTGRNEKNDNAG